MRIMVVGASRGLGRAFVEGLCDEGDMLVGVSRHKPEALDVPAGVDLRWIEADLSRPVDAAESISRQAPSALNALVYNLGIWEDRAFEDDYAFQEDRDSRIVEMVNANITAAILLLKRLVPAMLGGTRPQVILTGSTSGLPGSGRPEVTFGASKFALRGIADALREGFREQRLAVTCLQLGYLNTEDPLSAPRDRAADRGQGTLIPVHDVVRMVRALLSLSDASYVREMVMPAIRDERF